VRFEAQRLRNLTTGRLHTEISHVYEDIACITGIQGLMTHQLSKVIAELLPWLKTVVTDESYWDKEYMPSIGEYDLKSMTEFERSEFFKRLTS